MGVETQTLSQLFFELFGLSFSTLGDSLIEGGGLGLGVVAVVCVVLVLLDKGLISYIACGIGVLICLSAIMSKGGGLREAISVFFIIAGLWTMTVANLIAILMGKYYKIKKNLILGAIGFGIGLAIGGM